MGHHFISSVHLGTFTKQSINQSINQARALGGSTAKKPAAVLWILYAFSKADQSVTCPHSIPFPLWGVAQHFISRQGCCLCTIFCGWRGKTASQLFCLYHGGVTQVSLLNCGSYSPNCKQWLFGAVYWLILIKIKPQAWVRCECYHVSSSSFARALVLTEITLTSLSMRSVFLYQPILIEKQTLAWFECECYHVSLLSFVHALVLTEMTLASVSTWCVCA